MHCIFSCVVLGKLFPKVFFHNQNMSKSAVFFSITHIEKYAKTIHLGLDTLLRGPNTPYVVCLIAGAVGLY